jgi:hypothetical protein
MTRSAAAKYSALTILTVLLLGVLLFVLKAPESGVDQQNRPKSIDSELLRDTNRPNSSSTSNRAPAFEGQIPGAPAEPTSAWLAMEGYLGPFYGTMREPPRITVLPQTLTVGQSAAWNALGLLHNNTATDVEINRLAVTLIDSSGGDLATVSSWLPHSHVRAGEPAPFVVTTDVPRRDVASVKWDVEHLPCNDDACAPTTHALELTIFWQQPYGSRQRLTRPPARDPENPPFPYWLVGTVRNVSQRNVARTQVTAAWLDAANRVIHVAILPLHSFDDYEHDYLNLALKAGEGADFAYSNSDPALAARLTNARIALWGIAE